MLRNMLLCAAVFLVSCGGSDHNHDHNNNGSLPPPETTTPDKTEPTPTKTETVSETEGGNSESPVKIPSEAMLGAWKGHWSVMGLFSGDVKVSVKPSGDHKLQWVVAMQGGMKGNKKSKIDMTVTTHTTNEVPFFVKDEIKNFEANVKFENGAYVVEGEFEPSQLHALQPYTELLPKKLLFSGKFTLNDFSLEIKGNDRKLGNASGSFAEDLD